MPPVLSLCGKDFAFGLLAMPEVLHYDGPMSERKELWPGGPTYTGDSVGADSLALAAFARTPQARRGCDLGCGSGILLLLLAWENPALSMEGVEMRPAAAEQCRENLAANGLSGRCQVRIGDLRESATAGCMDLVVANPPYFPAGSGAVSNDPERARMRTESATLAEVCASASHMLRPGGDFCLVHRSERLAEVLCALSAASLEPKRLRFLAAESRRAPKLFLCRARKGASPGLTVEPPLCQFDSDGTETDEYRKLCHWEGQP